MEGKCWSSRGLHVPLALFQQKTDKDGLHQVICMMIQRQLYIRWGLCLPPKLKINWDYTIKFTMLTSLCSLLIRDQDRAAAANTPPAGCRLRLANWNPPARRHVFLCCIYLWDPQCSVNGQAWAKACKWLDICSGGQRPSALSVDRKGERFEVLGIDVPVISSHRLKKVLAWDNLFIKRVRGCELTWCTNRTI